jgi:enoyl-CoA hydratase/carnithine racemase
MKAQRARTVVPTVTLAEHDGIAEILIDRPPANALDNPTLVALGDHLTGLSAAPVSGLVLTGAGNRFFSAGGDLKELEALDMAGGLARVDAMNRVVGLLAPFPAAVVGVANGTAVGGGTELLLACDHVVAARGARFGLPEINHGLLPSAASVAAAVRRLGSAVARDLLLSGRLFDVDEAVELGLVHEVAASADEARERGRRWVAGMSAKPQVLVAAMKRALREAPGLDHEALVELTREQFGVYFEDRAATAARDRVLQRWRR